MNHDLPINLVEMICFRIIDLHLATATDDDDDHIHKELELDPRPRQLEVRTENILISFEPSLSNF